MSLSREPLAVQLVVAIRYNRLSNVKRLLAQGANVNSRHNTHKQTALAWATSSRPNIVKYLINKGATVNARDDQGRTPLMSAVLHGREDNVRTLLDAGANINARDKNGVTPLMWAVFNRRTNIVRLLLSRGARLNNRSNNGRYAMNFMNTPMVPGGWVQPMKNNNKNEMRRLLVPRLSALVRRELTGSLNRRR
jgi:ankyrin repeat protein